MLHQEEEQVRLRRQNSKQAISLAMEGRWSEAAEANKSIIADFPKDLEAYNRLGRAYMELGEYTKARESYQHTIELDPYNAIAEKNLRRLTHLKDAPVVKEGPPAQSKHRVEPRMFIEETGKAGVVSLSRLAAQDVLAEVVAGDGINLKIEGSNLVAEEAEEKGRYLGRVDSKYGQRLIRLMGGGNRYSATVISSSEAHLAIIIREVFQHPSQAGQLSFPSKGLDSFKSYFGGHMASHDMGYGESDSEEEAEGYNTAEEGDSGIDEEPLEDEELEDEEKED